MYDVDNRKKHNTIQNHLYRSFLPQERKVSIQLKIGQQRAVSKNYVNITGWILNVCLN